MNPLLPPWPGWARVFTIPSKLFAENEILGTINIGLEDDGMGILSGLLQSAENYYKYRDFLRKTLLEDSAGNLMRINHFTNDNKFKVIADDGTEFKEPVAGLVIYDVENEPIQVGLNGIDSEI